MQHRNHFMRIGGLFRTNSLTLKLIATLLAVITVAVTVTGIITYNQAVHYVERENVQYASNVALTISSEIDGYMDEMDRIGKIVLGNAEVQRILSDSQSPSYTSIQKLKDSEYITNLIISFTSVRDSMMINLYNGSLESFYTGPSRFANFDSDLKDRAWIRANLSRINSREIHLVPPDKIDQGLPTRLFGVIQCVNRIDNNATFGYITIMSDINILHNIINDDVLSADNGVHIVVLDQERTVLLDSNNRLTGKKYTAENRPFVTQVSNLSGWTTVVAIPNTFKNALLNVKEVRNHLLWMSALVIVGSLILAALLSVYMLQPIRRIIKSMRLVRNGNFDIQLNEEGLDPEMKQLYGGFNAMVFEIKKLIRKIYDDGLLLRSAQMDALQLQISPHFLYNTLQTMEALGEVREVPEVQIIAESLGKLFHYNIRGSHIVRLGDELDHVRTYFDIEKIRFRDKVDCIIDVDDKLKEYRILKFILQPIVENSILHGFRGLKRKGIVTIHAEADNGVLTIRVSDNGAGIRSPILRFLHKRLEECREGSFSGAAGDLIGIFNVQKRLINYYGVRYGLSIESGEHAGTTVTLTLPLTYD
ncbi:sensor histidine kinase [Paenibacillus humicola]|uniref:sensor histidine kinase n=1 Tax=Paenibacillus humicola TaxID=3110540 RepID=UPI00237A5623|nr:histidine kinase [Paenibacillus humicola]